MLTLLDAVDFFCSRGLAEKTRNDYRRLLHRFNKDFPPHMDVVKVEEEDILRYLGTRRHLSRGTQAWEESVLSSFFDWLHKSRKIKTNPMVYVPRTKRVDGESLDLKTVSSHEVGLMMEAAETWSERLCFAVLAYLGPRRGGAARLRLRDYERRANRRLRFYEKGGKVIWKPVPYELALILEEALKAGVITDPKFYLDAYPDGVPDGLFYLVPPEWRLQRQDRDDRVIWRIVTKVAKRAGVDAHTHSIRAAFADFCLDSGMDGKALQLLMGHKNPSTTERYTRRYDQQRRMEGVLGLSWDAVIADNKRERGLAQPSGSTLDESYGVGAGGFEPPEDEPRGEQGAGTQRSGSDDLTAPVFDPIDELVSRMKHTERDRS
jgi:integrase/recombinase XerD